jgi:hypothetical protein
MANICEICVNYDFYPTEDSWMTKEGVFHHDKLKKKKKIEIVRSSSDQCGVARSYSTQIFVTCCSFMEYNASYF